MKCQKCKKEIEVDLKEKNITKECIQVYYECQYCKMYYPLWREPKSTKKKLEEKRTLVIAILMKKNKKLEKKFIDRIKTLNTEIYYDRGAYTI